MTKEELTALIHEYSLPEGWYARVPSLQEPANYGTKFETGIYEVQMKSGYRLPLHPLALEFFKHYCMAPGQLVPNGWRKLIGLVYLVETSEQRLEYGKIIPRKSIPAGLSVLPPSPVALSTPSTETAPLALERRLERAKKKIAEEAKKIAEARDQGIRDFLDGNAGEECIFDIPLDNFVMPPVVSPSGETAAPSEARDAAASQPPMDGPSGDDPEP
ncbi:hypothetical protein RJ640_026735 [Escallonia rubra]|uniref:Transposase (putative) gypsy type domain-containing protein n=1 Tax=Escallonia rubra TaxID=112253 RepID=A0AA88R774_9ASTE|nr:hypothetical protein RJ640_026735 [Escallonia rubra]